MPAESYPEWLEYLETDSFRWQIYDEGPARLRPIDSDAKSMRVVTTPDGVFWCHIVHADGDIPDAYVNMAKAVQWG